MVNGKDLWDIAHQLEYSFGDGRIQTVCGKADPMRATDDPADCVYCTIELERRSANREAWERLEQEDLERYKALRRIGK